MAGTPTACMASVHCAAATESFLVMENHSVDVPWWGDMVNGVEKPMVNKDCITVPEGPGRGITSLNVEVIKQHLLEPGYFEPTLEWDRERSNDRLWSQPSGGKESRAEVGLGIDEDSSLRLYRKEEQR
jgi:hypothetical protein